ncbi:hypothetical protein ET532_015080, partial [Verminephrobacter sp. Larva24]
MVVPEHVAQQAPTPFVLAVGRADDGAAAARKPVCIVKSGRSEAGARAAASHTASLAGAWPAFEAICRRWGVYLFETIYDLLQGAQLLQRGKRVESRGVAVTSGSGGAGALLADAL